jgi:hypothetical protein
MSHIQIELGSPNNGTNNITNNISNNTPPSPPRFAMSPGKGMFVRGGRKEASVRKSGKRNGGDGRCCCLLRPVLIVPMKRRTHTHNVSRCMICSTKNHATSLPPHTSHTLKSRLVASTRISPDWKASLHNGIWGERIPNPPFRPSSTLKLALRPPPQPLTPPRPLPSPPTILSW